MSALAEALRTTYVQGKWVYSDSSHTEKLYRVVAPVLSGSGDYSSYMKCK